MTAPLQYLLITVKVFALEKVSFSNTQTAHSVFKHTDSRREALSA